MVRALINRFYDLMDEDPDYFGIRKLHPESVAGSREKLFMFLSGWLGGPPLYIGTYGHPRVGARGLPVATLNARRGAWVSRMARALQGVDAPEAPRVSLGDSFAHTAEAVHNKEP